MEKNRSFHKEIEEFSTFDADITEALTALGPTMFKNDLNNFKDWLERKIPALDGKIPLEISKINHGMDWMYEFILRS